MSTREELHWIRKAIDRVMAGYLGTTGVLLVISREFIDIWLVLLIVHVLLIGMILRNSSLRNLSAPVQFIRDWYPVFLLSPLFKEVELLAAAIGDWRLTGIIQDLDVQIFGEQWSILLSEMFPFVALSEFLHFCYFGYVLLLPFVGGLWYFRGDRLAFHELFLLVVTTYGASYIFFIFLPVDSPFYLVPPPGEPVAGHFFYELVHWVSSRGGARGGAFPSSHVSVSVVIWFVALKYDLRVAWIISPIVLGIIVATVYGRFHYVLDVVAGLLLAVGVVGVYSLVWCRPRARTA